MFSVKKYFEYSNKTSWLEWWKSELYKHVLCTGARKSGKNINLQEFLKSQSWSYLGIAISKS